MKTRDWIMNNKTSTFKKGQKVEMFNCGEADHYQGKTWTCQTDSFKNESGDDVVFLEELSGSFLVKYLKKG